MFVVSLSSLLPWLRNRKQRWTPAWKLHCTTVGGAVGSEAAGEAVVLPPDNMVGLVGPRPEVYRCVCLASVPRLCSRGALCASALSTQPTTRFCTIGRFGLIQAHVDFNCERREQLVGGGGHSTSLIITYASLHIPHLPVMDYSADIYLIT